jgi:hypothetical protein
MWGGPYLASSFWRTQAAPGFSNAHYVSFAHIVSAITAFWAWRRFSAWS